MSLRGDVLHSLKWLAGARFAGQLIAWGVTLVVIRILKPSDYGLLAIAEIFIGFAQLFREMGLYEAIIQKRDITSRQIEQSFGFLLVGNSSIYAILFMCAPLIANFFGDDRLTDMLRILGIQFPLIAVGVVQDAMLSRRMDFKRKSFVNLVVTLSNSVVTLTLALLGAGVWALVYGALAGSIVRPIGLVIAAQYWCRPRFSREGMRELARFGGFVTTSRLLWFVYSKADVFIIGKILGKDILGFYAIAMELAKMPSRKVSELLKQVGFAAYSSLDQEMAAIRWYYLKAVRVLGFIAFPVFWGISCVSSELVSVVLGQRWEPAIVPLQLLSLVMPIQLLAHSTGSPLLAIGKAHIGTLNLLIAVILMPPLFLIGTWYGGLTGVCIAWVLGYPVLVLIRLRISLPYLQLRIRDYLQSIAGPAFGAAAMYICVSGARHWIAVPFLSPAEGLVFLIMVGALVYPAFMWSARRQDSREVIALVRNKSKA